MKKVVFFDTETTASDTKVAEIVQISVVGETHVILNEYFKPDTPITVEAMAVHHITPMKVEKLQSFDASQSIETVRALISEGAVFAAHNIAFDAAVLANHGVVIPAKQQICTMKVARAIDENEKWQSYGLQYLRYALGLYDVEVPEGTAAHDALYDTIVLREVFGALVNMMRGQHEEVAPVIDEMIKITQEPAVIRRMPFGKYKGERLEDVPEDYIMWISQQDADNYDLLYNLQKAKSSKVPF